ncbi:sulfatase family protein [Reichenbachiella versicolor]|uniref:sulfatase family protein n=1 Tax=Reichenbachiella versicolor TaxID=1821036 RepID=UPI000D6E950F|nr:sulfatase [Reichenbachiella versicolor]
MRLILLFLLPIIGLTKVESKTNPPNVIIIFADDLGYGDLKCFGGAKGYQTPSLDKMAAEGMKFTDFSVSNPICTPSRAALLTGRYPHRWGYKGGVFFPRDTKGMPQSEETIAEMLKAKGYKTAAVGKWHLGHKPEFLPTSQGFDEYFGIPYSNDMWHDGDAPIHKDAKILEGYTIEDYKSYTKDQMTKENIKKYRDKVPLVEGEQVIEWPVDQTQLTKRYTDRAISFIQKNKKKPFFLYMAHTMPHTPLFASEQFKGKTERGLYGDVVEEIDWSVGQVLQAIKKAGIEKNTLVVFTSDNGPWLVKKQNGGSAGDLRGGKMTTFEGGVRVPCIAQWKGMIPEGKVCKQHIASMDLLPTIATLAGVSLPNDRAIDGIDVSHILKGNFNQDTGREFYLIAFNNRDMSIRVGDWKYRKGTPTNIPNKKLDLEIQLFNLKDDPNERNNLADQYPNKVKEMAALLDEKFAEIKQ